MSPSGTSAQHLTSDKRIHMINALVDIMHDSWDTPADCNDGELFTYGELLLDRIEAGEDRAALNTFLSEVQTERLGIPASGAHQVILDRALALIGRGKI
jgi:hypothetical protein